MNKFCYQVSMAFALLMVAGCQGKVRESLHENDHVVPNHWPSNMHDAATKIEVRVAKLREQQSLSRSEFSSLVDELTDIIGWVPEVAADSALTEADWVPVNDMSESLLKRLRKEPTMIGDDTFTELIKFRHVLLDRACVAEAKLPPATSVDVKPKDSQEVEP
jgi:hypothetical protein